MSSSRPSPSSRLRLRITYKYGSIITHKPQINENPRHGRIISRGEGGCWFWIRSAKNPPNITLRNFLSHRIRWIFFSSLKPLAESAMFTRLVFTWTNSVKNTELFGFHCERVVRIIKTRHPCVCALKVLHVTCIPHRVL